jgi:hypothetical protein
MNRNYLVCACVSQQVLQHVYAFANTSWYASAVSHIAAQLALAFCCCSTAHRQVAVDSPEALLAGDVGVIADFLAAKLKDW